MNSQYTLNISEQNTLFLIFRHLFTNIYKVLSELDPKEAEIFQTNNHYFHEQENIHDQQHDHSHKSCSEELLKYFFIPRDKMTFFQKDLDEMLKDYNFKDYISIFLEDLSKKFFNIKNNGIKDKLEWNDEAEKFVINQLTSQGVNTILLNELRKKARKDDYIDSKQPLLLATPNSWYEKYPKIKLDFLKPETIRDFFSKGYSYQDFANSFDLNINLFNETIYFYHEGRFEAPSQLENDSRNDRFLNFTFSMLETKSTPNLFELCRCLIALPFEFNSKANILAQASESFQLSYFKKNGFHKLHFDSSFLKEKDTGRKISILYLFTDDKKKSAKITLFNAEKEKIDEIILTPCKLFMLKSRIQSYELTEISSNSFILRYWINGPSDESNLKF